MNNWHTKTPEEIVALLGTDLYAGLSRKEASARSRKEKNILFPRKAHTVWDDGKQLLFSFMPILLLITAAAAFWSDHRGAGWVLLLSLLFQMTALLAAYCKARSILDKQEEASEAAAKVIRSGKLFVTPSENLVAGDIVLLQKGDVIPADCRLVSADGLIVRESGITKNHLAEKNPFTTDPDDPQNAPCMLWAGCAIEEGFGRAIVCEIGQNTYLTATKEKIRDSELENTPYVKRLKKLSAMVSAILLGLLFLFAVVGFLPFTPPSLLEAWMLGCAFAASTMSEFYTAFAYITVGNALFGALEMKNTRLFRSTRNDTPSGVSGGTLIRKPGKLDKIAAVNRLILNPSLFTVRATYTLSGVVDPAGKREAIDETLSTSMKGLLRNAALAMGDIDGKGLAADSRADGADKRALLSKALAKATVFAGKEGLYTPLGNGVSEGGILYGLVERDNGLFVTLLAPCEALLASCTHCLEEGRIVPLSENAAKAIAAYASSAEKVPVERLAVAIGVCDARALSLPGRVLSDEALLSFWDNGLVFEGFLVFEKQVQKETASALAAANAAGIGVTLFCENDAELDVASYFDFALALTPQEAVEAPRVALGPLSFDEKRALISAYQKKGEKVAYLGTSLADLRLLKSADTAITCGTALSREAMIEMPAEGAELRDDQSLMVKEVKGLAAFGCDALRATADLMVSPASVKGQGGFASLLEALFRAKALFCNMTSIMRYLITLGAAKLVLTFAALLSGVSFVSPVVLALMGLGYDFIAVMVMALRRPDSRHLFYKHSEKRMGALVGHSLAAGFLSGAIALAASLLAMRFFAASAELFITAALLLLSLVIFLFASLRRRDGGAKRSYAGMGITVVTLLLTALLLTAADTALTPLSLLLLLCLLLFVLLQCLLSYSLRVGTGRRGT